MKIIYYFAQFNGPMYHWQDDHIIDELKHYGIEINIFNPLNYESITIANEELLKHLKKTNYDMFLTCNTDEFLFIDTVKELKKFSMPLVLYCFDSLMTPYAHRKIAGLFDLVMISQNDVNGIFKKYNSNTIVSHYAANPFFFQYKDIQSYVERIAFVGTPYGSRANVINDLLSAKIPLDLYCNNNTASNINYKLSNIVKKLESAQVLFKSNVGRKVLASGIKSKFIKHKDIDYSSKYLNHFDAVDLQITNDIYSSHSLSLSVSTARNTGLLANPVDIVHLRNFEIPMCGGVQFCKYFPELADQFEEDKEIIFYHSTDEMKDKVKYYLKPTHSSSLNKIRVNARKKAENEHTWYRRFSMAFDNLGLITNK